MKKAGKLEQDIKMAVKHGIAPKGRKGETEWEKNTSLNLGLKTLRK